jgi:dUTP pyrophosphatase
VDAGYRGEVLVGMVNVGDKPYTFLRGHKVAQLLIQKIEQAEIVAVETLDETSRGEGGFGSTGK